MFLLKQELTANKDIYDDAFFAGIDGVTNALDNVTARRYSYSMLYSPDH